MKKALIHIPTNEIVNVVGPAHPDRPEVPITANTAFLTRAQDCRWLNADDEVTKETHIFDGAKFIPKPPPTAEEIEAASAAYVDEVLNRMGALQVQICLDVENRLRRLEGKHGIDRQQYRAELIERLKMQPRR